LRLEQSRTVKPIRRLDLEDRLSTLTKGRRVVVLFVGNPLRGDDGAPQLLHKALLHKVTGLMLLDCGTTPQDCIEKVVGLEPHIAVFVNAVDRALKPGSIILDKPYSMSTADSSLLGHKVPLAWVASLLKIVGQQRNLVIKTLLIGIQISSTKGAMSAPVRKTVKSLSKLFQELDTLVACGNG
jgi:hydrogenase maturation protease